MQHDARDRYHKKLKDKMDEYVHFIYSLTKRFPRDELYGVTSQIRRSSLSVVLNYIEGFARKGDKTYKNFLDISYGSLKESMYLLDFSYKEDYVEEIDYNKALKMANEIGAMLWGILRNLQ